MANKLAIVTGGAGGIGQAVVARLAQSGFGVCIVDQKEKAGLELIEQLRKDKYEAEFYRAELRRAAEIKEVFETIYAKRQRIDVLVNLAGGTIHKHPINEFPLSEWREVIDVNLKATFLCCQAVSKRMKEAKSGAISTRHPISASPAAPGGPLTRPPKLPSLLFLNHWPWKWRLTVCASIPLPRVSPQQRGCWRFIAMPNGRS